MQITQEPEFLPPSYNYIGKIGRQVIMSMRKAGRAGLLLLLSLRYLKDAFKKRTRREILGQMYMSGIKSLGVISIVAVFTGMILALQTGIELRKFNQETFIGSAVMISMLREMGPFMTGLILAACVGSSMAAQLGTMTVSEEIEALEVMSINPVRFLVLPRLVAMCIMTPLLSFYTCILGVIGGGIVGLTQLGVKWAAYFDNATRYAEVKDLYVGLLKAFVFGVLITIISCHEGFSTTRGAVGVGMATRKSVISAFLFILMTGYFITRLFYYE